MRRRSASLRRPRAQFLRTFCDTVSLSALPYRQHHFTTFSHHNSFWPLDPEPTPQPHNKSLNVWNSTPLNLSFVDYHKLPMSPSYRAAVVASGGGATVYEYIRDHLGYRLEVRGTPTVAVVGRTLTVNATISNYGFAAPVHPRPVLITLQGGKWPGDAKVVWAANVSGTPDVRSWQPHAPYDPLRAILNHSLDTTVELPAEVAPGEYIVGIALPDARRSSQRAACDEPSSCIRFATTKDGNWSGGVNGIARVTVGARTTPRQYTRLALQSTITNATTLSYPVESRRYPEAPDLLIVTNRNGGLSVWNTSDAAHPRCVHFWAGNLSGYSGPFSTEGQDRRGDLLVLTQLGDRPRSAIVTLNATTFAPLARLPLSVDGALHVKLYRHASSARLYAIVAVS